MRLLPLLLLGCGFARWPNAEDVFPAVYTSEEGLEEYEVVRWETEDWNPADDLATAAQYLLKAQNHRPGAPVESLEHFDLMRPELPSLGSGVRLSFVGDVMWIGSNWDAFALPSADLLDGDLRIGNLETPVSPLHSTEASALGLYAFNAPTEMLDGLPLDLLQLNNNHSLDAGNDGLDATITEVEARDYLHTGIDAHPVVDVAGTRVAVLAYTWGLNVRGVEPSSELFIVPFGHVGQDFDMDGVVADIGAAREDADSVVVLLHWGFEYEYFSDPHFMVLARQMIEAGADVLVGSGPHVLQPPEICHVNQPEFVPGIGTCSVRTEGGEPRNAAVLYSLGNFGTGMPTIQAQVGMVATVSLDPDVTGLGWEPVATVDGVDGPEVVPLADLLDDPDYAEEDARLDLHLGTGWRR